jgi:hypothetical protein
MVRACHCAGGSNFRYVAIAWRAAAVRSDVLSMASLVARRRSPSGLMPVCGKIRDIGSASVADRSSRIAADAEDGDAVMPLHWVHGEAPGRHAGRGGRNVEIIEAS